MTLGIADLKTQGEDKYHIFKQTEALKTVEFTSDDKV